jgi:hypothetical protein
MAQRIHTFFTESGKQEIASMYGFETWDDYWDWRETNPRDYRRLTNLLLASLRERAELEAEPQAGLD